MGWSVAEENPRLFWIFGSFNFLPNEPNFSLWFGAEWRNARPAETFAHHERLEIPRRPLGMVRRRRDDRPPAGRSNGVATGEQALRKQPGRNGQRRACLLAFRLFERAAGHAQRARAGKAYEKLASPFGSWA